MSAPDSNNPPASDADRIDVIELLTIDVGAELRKVAQAQLSGTWQLPAELVRRTLGALRVDVWLGRTLVVEDDGDPIEKEEIFALAALLDEQLRPAHRHDALVALEEGGNLPLVALAGAGASRITVVGYDWREKPGLGYRIDWVRGQRPVVSELSSKGRGTRIHVEGLDLDRRQARAWLESVCRFTPPKVFIDGEPAPRSFDAALFKTTMDAAGGSPLLGELSIPREGDHARVWLLLDGVVSSQFAVTRVPCFEAALEMRQVFWLLGRQPTGLGDLRDEAVKHLPELLRVARAFLVEQAAQIQTLGPRVARRIRELILTQIRHSAEADDLLDLPLYRDLPRGGAAERWLSVNDLYKATRGEDICALEPGDDPARYVLPDGPVLVVDSAERSLLARAVGFSFRAPPLRPEARSATARLVEALSDGLHGLAHALRQLRFRKVTPVPPEALSPAERGFAEALARQLPCSDEGDDAEVWLCEGRGPIRRLERGLRWALPRANPTVVACVRAWSANPAWIYPVAFAVLDGKDAPDPDAAEAWRAPGDKAPSPAGAADP